MATPAAGPKCPSGTSPGSAAFRRIGRFSSTAGRSGTCARCHQARSEPWNGLCRSGSVRLSIASAETVESRAVIDADVCVVGAGPAGLAIARQLCGLGRTVLLLESGGLAVDQATADLNELADAGSP